MASNVVNVHITPNALRRTLAQITVATHYTGLALINYPQSPRKLPDLTARHIQDLLVSFFHTVAHVDASCPVWMLSHPREQYAQDVLSITPDFTPAEIDAANIRPSGAVGRNPILPRVLLAIFDR